MRSFSLQSKLPVAGAALCVLAYLGLVQLHWRHGSLTFENTPQTLSWYGLAFGGYLVALVSSEWQGGISLRVIFVGAALFRFLLLFTVPTLSGDVHRYVWEGYIANQGVSPYAYPIDSPELDHLDIPQRALVDHAWMASPYLPAAQIMFIVVTRLLPLHPVSFQFVLICFDLLSGLLLVQLLRLSGLPDRRVLLYLWNPLVVLEVAQGAHLDAWMILLTLLALWLTFSPHPRRYTPWSPTSWLALTNWLGPISLALATLTKVVPGLLVSVLFWRWRWWQHLLFGLVIVGIIAPIGMSAGWGLSEPVEGNPQLGHGLFAALRIFADRWNYNSGLFHWLEVYLMRIDPALANDWAKQAVGGAMLLILMGVWLAGRKLTTPRSQLRLMAVPLIAYVLLSTTVHPWYILILLAFLPFLPPSTDESHRRWMNVVPWLYLSGVIPLSYWTYLNPLDLREFAWVRNIEWLPTLGLLLIAVVVNIFDD